MSVRVFYDILNQKGTPAMYTDTLANRPTFGFAGRLFISTDSGQIFEDTGSAWTLVADAGVGGGTLSSVCLNGNTTATGIVITAGGLSSNSITNTGITEGSVLFAGASGLQSQSNATFFWDNTNKRLGIGNASPGAPLDIHGTGTQIQVNGTGSNNSYIQFQNAGVSKWRIGNTYNGAANTFDLYNHSLTSTALSFNVTTNAATFNNSITATSVAISGGTSAQFLKADGTTDSNTYLTTSSASSTYLPLAGGTLTGALSGTSITGTSLVKSGGTSAQILAANGSVITAGTNITISGGTISASGGGGSMAIGGSITSATAGSVLYAGASGVLAQTNASFYYDYTNNRLGLGTTSPGAIFDINIPNVGGTDLIRFSNSAGGSGDIAKFQYGASGQFVLNLLTVASARRNFAILNGDVGVGVISPSNQFDVVRGTAGTMGRGTYESGSFSYDGDMKLGLYTSSASSSAGASLIFGQTNLTSTGGVYPGFELQYVYNSGTSNSMRINSVSRNSAGSVTASTQDLFTVSQVGKIGINLAVANIGSTFQVNGNAAIGYSSSTAAPTNGMKIAGIINTDSRLNVNGATDNALNSLNSGGTLYTAGFSTNATAISTNTYSILSTGTTTIYNGTGAATWTLPNPSGVNSMFWIRNAGTGIITLNAYSGTNIINNANASVSSISIAIGATVLIQQDGNVKSYQLQ